MLKEFDAELQRGDNPGAWTCVVMDDVAELFGTRGLVKIRGAIDGEPFAGALMAQGDGTHRLPVKAALRKTIGKKRAMPSTSGSTSESGSCRGARFSVPRLAGASGATAYPCFQNSRGSVSRAPL